MKIALVVTGALATCLVLDVAAQTTNPSKENQRATTAEASKPKSDKDLCLESNDHAACKKYFRAQCLRKDAEACGKYAETLKSECKPYSQGMSPPEVSESLACNRKVQCWQDRTFALKAMNDICNADPNSSECSAAKSRFTNVSARNCDQGSSGVF